MQEGALEDAVNAFRKAYERHQDPRYQYNIGVALKAMGRDAAALEAFERFLKDAQQVPPEFLADARRQRDGLVQKVGQLQVVSTQDGATVLLDGRPSGQTPIAGVFHLDPGSYVVRVEKPGFEGYQESVRITSGKTARVEVALQLVPATDMPEAVPVPASGEPLAAAEVEATAAMPVEENEREVYEAGPSRLSALVGLNLWLGGVPAGAEPSASFGLAAEHRLWQRQAMAFELSGQAAMAFLTENDRRITFTSLVAAPTLRWFLQPRLSLFVRGGIGLLVLSGLEAPSDLLKPTATEATGALSALELRPMVGVAYALAPNVSWFLSAGFIYSPRPDPEFREGAFTRLDTSTGASFHF